MPASRAIDPKQATNCMRHEGMDRLNLSRSESFRVEDG
jgi:hypothetical protein